MDGIILIIACGAEMTPKLSSCKGQTNQVFCNDQDCGNRDENGLHWVGENPKNKKIPKLSAEERAKDILTALNDNGGRFHIPTGYLDLISNHVAQAEAEAYERGRREGRLRIN